MNDPCSLRRHIKNVSYYNNDKVFEFNNDGTLREPEVKLQNLRNGKWKEVSERFDTSRSGQVVIDLTVVYFYAKNIIVSLLSIYFSDKHGQSFET